MFSKDFVPTKPFPDFKWKWACLQCTEGINDLVILLGVLFRMKKLEIIIKPEKLEDLKAVLETEEVNGLNIVNTMGYGNQKGIIKNYRGAEYAVNLLPKIKVETVVTDETAPKLIDKIVAEINTGNIGDGKIFMYEVEDAIRIRTGEHGENAL